MFAFVIFWREGRGPKKNILKKWKKWKKWKMENGKWKMENGKWRGEPKCGFLIIEQSLHPTNTLRECKIITLFDY